MEQVSFYFTKQDPDYRVKGARDPLGLQVIWQKQGRELIPYLSTVCRSLRDFQILSLAYYFYGKPADNLFIPFFLRFEQLMAYTRYRMSQARDFGGVNRVVRFLETRNRIQLSADSKDQILSDQRSYGIWAKYNRPYNEIGIHHDPRFENIYEQKTNEWAHYGSAKKIVQQLINQPRVTLDKELTEMFEELLQVTHEEQQFYREKLLQVDNASGYQNKVFQFYRETSPPSFFELCPFIDAFSQSLHAQESGLQAILRDMKATEQILAPADRIFRYLLTKPIWSRQEIENNEYLLQCRPVAYHVFDTTSPENIAKNELSLALQSENWQLLQYLIARNKTVANWRGGAAWISLKDGLTEVHQHDMGSVDLEFDPGMDTENNYFLDTYHTLFTQLQS